MSFIPVSRLGAEACAISLADTLKGGQVSFARGTDHSSMMADFRQIRQTQASAGMSSHVASTAPAAVA